MGTIIDLSKPVRKPTSAEEEFLRSHPDTEIIHLQNYDNFYSLMDRLYQRDTSGQVIRRLLLVWPVRSRILETPAEFGKLRGWCLRHDHQIALVIPGDDVRRKMAKEQGLPAFPSIQEAGSTDWEIRSDLPEPEAPSERARRLAMLREDAERDQPASEPLGIRLLFFLLSLAVTAAVLCAILPQAKVEITPFLTRKSIDLTIWTNDKLDTVTMGGGIPTVEKTVELTLRAVVPSSGQIRTEPAIAIGKVSIRNTCDRTFSASAGAELSTEEDFGQGVLFHTLEAVSLAPGEQKEVRIEALLGGKSGNLQPGSIRFPATAQAQCWEIRQTAPTEGGQDGIYPAPTEQDRTAARMEIERQIPDAVRTALENDPEGKDLLPLGEAVITNVKLEQFTPETGFTSKELTLRKTIEVTIKTVRRSDMESIIRSQAARLNTQAAGLTGYEILSGPSEENGLSRWAVRAEYLVYEPETNEEALQIMLRGKTIPQAQTILNTLQHVKESRITLLPSWMKHMPLAAQNIRVIIYPAVETELP